MCFSFRFFLFEQNSYFFSKTIHTKKLHRFTNNLLSTAQAMYLKATLAAPAGAVAPMGSTTYVKEQVVDVEVEDARPTGEF